MQETTGYPKLSGAPRGNNWADYILEGSVNPTYSTTLGMFIRASAAAPREDRLYAMGWKQSLEQDSAPVEAFSIQTSPEMPDGQYSIGAVVEQIEQNEETSTMTINHWRLMPAMEEAQLFDELQTRLYILMGIDPDDMPISRIGVWVLANRVTGPLYDTGGSTGGLLGTIYSGTNYPPPALSGPVSADPSSPGYTEGPSNITPLLLAGIGFAIGGPAGALGGFALGSFIGK